MATLSELIKAELDSRGVYNAAVRSGDGLYYRLNSFEGIIGPGCTDPSQILGPTIALGDEAQGQIDAAIATGGFEPHVISPQELRDRLTKLTQGLPDG
jgi:hypothetical protein